MKKTLIELAICCVISAVITIFLIVPGIERFSTSVEKRQAKNLVWAQKEARKNPCLSCHVRDDGPAPLPPNGPPKNN